jgi:carbon monoxide dehydrogenase subunit G
MQIATSFTVDAPPDEVFAYMLDVDKIVRCLPGAELVEVVDAHTFKGKLTMKVGAVKVAYAGTATISDTAEEGDQATVTLKANGREIGGQGAVRATLTLSIARNATNAATDATDATDATNPTDGTDVGINADFTVSGKLAQFGGGVIEDISRRLIKEMADCIGADLRPSASGG